MSIRVPAAHSKWAAQCGTSTHCVRGLNEYIQSRRELHLCGSSGAEPATENLSQLAKQALDDNQATADPSGE
jgi:hypothetical protein